MPRRVPTGFGLVLPYRGHAQRPGEPGRHENVVGTEIVYRTVPQTCERRVDTSAQNVKNVFDAGLPVRGEAPQIRPADHHRPRPQRHRLDFAAARPTRLFCFRRFSGSVGALRIQSVLDDIWENDVKVLAPGPPVSLLCTSRRRSLPWISRAHSLEVKSFSRGEAESIFRIYLGDETTEKHRDALLEFAERMERLPIAIVVGADILREEFDPVPEAARGLRLETDVPLIK